MIYFILSAVLLAAWSAALAGKFGSGTHDRAGLAVAAATFHIGAASVASSVFGQFTPAGFLAAQLVLLALLAIAYQRIPAISREIPLQMRAARRELPWLILMTIPIGWYIGGVIVKQAKLPVGGFDERMYHASRAAYWMQHQSVFWWETHNQRQVVFPFGSEMIFAWPLMMTRSEPVARTIFALALPLAAYGVYSLARALSTRRTIALLATLILVATPAVFRRSTGLKPDMWSAVYALGLAYWIVRALRTRERAAFAAAMVGVFFALAVNVKTTMLAMTPAIAVLPLLLRPTRRTAASLCIGAVIALLGSGLFVTLAQNSIYTGHPLGPAPMRDVHTAEISPHQLYVHACRLVLFLIEPPFIPTEELSQKWESKVNEAVDALGVATLSGEASDTWLEPFYIHARPLAENFAFAGMLWLPLLILSTIAAIRVKDRNTMRLQLLLGLLAFCLLGVAFVVRWMVGIDRFLLPAYAVTIPLVLVNLEHSCGTGASPVRESSARARRPCHKKGFRPSLRIIASAIFVLLMLVPSWLAQFTALQDELTSDYSWVDEPFIEVIPRLPPGSRIVLIASQDTRDYSLFLPRGKFANQVFTWGRNPIDIDRLNRMLDEHRATHLLITGVPEVSFHWDTPVDTTLAVRWADSQAEWRDIPLQFSPQMRLYRRTAPLDPPSPVQ